MIYRFDPFSLDTGSLELRKGNDVIPLEPQVFNILAYLIEHRERVVGKEELIENIWNGRAISDGALNSRINSARRAVGDSGSAQEIIKTFTRRGFRFIGFVSNEPVLDSRSSPPVLQAGKPSIAVLPFDNMSGDPEQEYFSDGISEDLITALSRIRQFFVVARSTTFVYKDRAVDVQAVARELGVRYLIEGSVRKAGNRVRISTQLIDGATGNHLWAERYDRELEDIFDLQDELTRTLVGAIQPELSKAEQGTASAKSPELLSAWDAYQRGMWHLNKFKPADLAAAESLFEQTIDLDPDFGPGYSGLALAMYLQFFYGVTGSRKETGDRAYKAAKMAIELDNDDANAHNALANIHLLRRDHRLVIVEATEALRLNPSLAYAHHNLGRALLHLGEAEEGLVHINEAIRLSPNDPQAAIYFGARAMAHLYLRQHEEAVEWAARAVRLPNAFWPVRAVLASALAHLDRMREAKQAVDDLLLFRPGISLTFVRETVPTDDQNYLDHLINGLSMAGLSE